MRIGERGVLRGQLRMNKRGLIASLPLRSVQLRRGQLLQEAPIDLPHCIGYAETHSGAKLKVPFINRHNI